MFISCRIRDTHIPAVTRGFRLVVLLGIFVIVAAPSLGQGIRVKDISTVAGARDNQLYGMGLVVGLNRTGARSLATQQIAIDMLRKLGVTSKIARQTLEDNVFTSSSISSVMVTANLPPFARKGTRLDVTVSVLDDANSLQGGTLLFTPLEGADGEVYAVAQGSVSIGGMQGFFPAPGQTQNHPTSGRIPSGAIVERQELGKILDNGFVRLLLHQPDYATARKIADAINKGFGCDAVTIDPSTIQVQVPWNLRSNPIRFISEVGLLEITPDSPARVVINERTGTVVVGNQVRISTVAIAHGNLVIEPATPAPAPAPAPGAAPAFPLLGQAAPLVPGQLPEGDKLNPVGKTVTVAELSRALNALGVTPKDLIAIFQALRESGALHAELAVM